jgi:hypothetical protein
MSKGESRKLPQKKLGITTAANILPPSQQLHTAPPARLLLPPPGRRFLPRLRQPPSPPPPCRWAARRLLLPASPSPRTTASSLALRSSQERGARSSGHPPSPFPATSPSLPTFRRRPPSLPSGGHCALEAANRRRIDGWRRRSRGGGWSRAHDVWAQVAPGEPRAPPQRRGPASSSLGRRGPPLVLCPPSMADRRATTQEQGKSLWARAQVAAGEPRAPPPAARSSFELLPGGKVHLRCFAPLRSHSLGWHERKMLLVSVDVVRLEIPRV